MMTRVVGGIDRAALCMGPLGMASLRRRSSPAGRAGSRTTRWTPRSPTSSPIRTPTVFGEFFRKRGEAAGQPEASAEDQANIAQVIKNFTPRQLATFPQANLDEEGLKALSEALAKVPAPAATVTPAPAAN
ncbi:hypothetical protein ACRAWD_30335 [Caulobacter segnis]